MSTYYSLLGVPYYILFLILFFEEDVDNEYINIYIRKEYIEKRFSTSHLTPDCVNHHANADFVKKGDIKAPNYI